VGIGFPNFHGQLVQCMEIKQLSSAVFLAHGS
jgi:hypothetical protein